MNSERQDDEEIREQSDASLPSEGPSNPPRQSSRRSFTKYLTIGGVVAIAAVVRKVFRARFSKPSYPQVIIAQAGEIPVGGSKIFQYPQPVDPCILIRADADSYVAYSRFCTHQECIVFYRPAQNGFECPCHGGFFSLADGSVLAGPPPRPLPRIVLERRGENLVATGVATA